MPAFHSHATDDSLLFRQVLTEENKKLKADCMRLEAESDKYSNELATVKVMLTYFNVTQLIGV